ncbi:MAG: nuclear transport factor 2 family protein [Rhodobiaceae bacterium]|nr:nuclear transport factor 2 family protein [Rhodobiaceae bacterium]
MPRPKSSKSIEERLDEIEDRFEILQLLASYGPAADSMNWPLMERIWAADMTYEMGVLGVANGHDEWKRVLHGEFHQGLMKSGSAHLTMMPHVVIDGDRATATGYALVVKQDSDDPGDEQFAIVRSTAVRWELERSEGRWVIKRRRNQSLNGSGASKDLLRRVTEGPE